jgi:hypothetical protein
MEQFCFEIFKPLCGKILLCLKIKFLTSPSMNWNLYQHFMLAFAFRPLKSLNRYLRSNLLCLKIKFPNHLPYIRLKKHIQSLCKLIILFLSLTNWTFLTMLLSYEIFKSLSLKFLTSPYLHYIVSKVYVSWLFCFFLLQIEHFWLCFCPMKSLNHYHWNFWHHLTFITLYPKFMLCILNWNSY